MDENGSKPREPRYDLRLSVRYRGPEGAGRATVWDLSGRGTRLELATNNVAPGTKIQLEFLRKGAPPIRTWAQVVRETETGFALRFLDDKSPLATLLGANPKHAAKAAAPEEDDDESDGTLPTGAGNPNIERSAPRHDTRLMAEYESDGKQYRGIVRDISASGARVERAPKAPPPGTELVMRFRVLETGFCRTLACEAVRTIDGGFAVRFTDSEDLRANLVAAALTQSRSSDPSSTS